MTEQWRVTTHRGGPKNHAIACGAEIIGHAVGAGYPLGKGWSPESEERARIMAAGPELLAALESLVIAYQHDADTMRDGGPIPTELVNARAIIAKAKGAGQ